MNDKQKIRLCLAGATGYMGQAIASATEHRKDMKIVSALARKSAGKKLPGGIHGSPDEVTITNDIRRALDANPDVLIDFTSSECVMDNLLAALERKINIVVGTTGLTRENYAEINELSMAGEVGVAAVANFSLSYGLLRKFAREAARYMNQWEIIDYGNSNKKDAPSGTAMDLAKSMAEIGTPVCSIPPGEGVGDPRARGASINNTQVHSLRLPGYYFSLEVDFGLPGERLSLRHDSINANPYVEGVFLAVKKVSGFTGLVRNLDELMG